MFFNGNKAPSYLVGIWLHLSGQDESPHPSSWPLPGSSGPPRDPQGAHSQAETPTQEGTGRDRTTGSRGKLGSLSRGADAGTRACLSSQRVVISPSRSPAPARELTISSSSWISRASFPEPASPRKQDTWGRNPQLCGSAQVWSERRLRGMGGWPPPVLIGRSSGPPPSNWTVSHALLRQMLLMYVTPAPAALDWMVLREVAILLDGTPDTHPGLRKDNTQARFRALIGQLFRPCYPDTFPAVLVILLGSPPPPLTGQCYCPSRLQCLVWTFVRSYAGRKCGFRLQPIPARPPSRYLDSLARDVGS